MRHQRFQCVAVGLAGVLTAGCSSVPLVLWPEVSLEPGTPGVLSIGAAAVDINPPQSVFLGGGIPYQRMSAIHDDLWSRAIVIDNGVHRIVLVSLDLIGLYYDDVVRVREAVAAETEADYVLVACTHTHHGPDVLGAWSPSPFCSEDPYQAHLRLRAAESVAQAVANLRPAHLRIAAGTSGDPPLTHDTRLPVIIDDTLTVWQAVDAETGDTIATAIHYASHPILVPTLNSEVGSDFVHYLREAIEEGLTADDASVEPSGGVCVFFNGALGGRLTPDNAGPLVNAPPVGGDYARAQAYGARLAQRAQKLLADEGELLAEPMAIDGGTRQIRVPVSNGLLSAGLQTCVFARSFQDNQVNSEVGVVRVGPVEFFAVPGMIFPEMIIGGIGPLAGSDFPDAPAESPVLADLATQPYPIVVGLANDMLGYIIPRSQWDATAPFTTEDGKAPYGEVISVGPDTAGIVIDAFAGLQP